MPCDIAGKAKVDSSAKWKGETNPFATKHISPKAPVHLLDSQHESIQVLSEFANQPVSSLGLVLGKHGAGKTTILMAALPILRKIVPTTLISLGAAGDSKSLWPKMVKLPRKSLLLIDGLEQLGVLQRAMLRLICWQKQISCLATSHRPIQGFQTLIHVSPGIEHAKLIASDLLKDQPDYIGEANNQIDRIWPQIDGNLRELWFSLYDWYQTQH